MLVVTRQAHAVILMELSYRREIDKYWPDTPPIQRIDRFSLYDQAMASFAVVMTGETAKYGNIILKKGVTPGEA